jgi:PilZ domain
MLSLEDFDLEEFLETMPLWAGFAAGILVAALVFVGGRRLSRRLTNRRAHPRRWGNPVQIVIAGFAGNTRGTVVNRSEGGVALLVGQPATPGTTFQIRAAEAPDSVPWAPVEVRHCRSAGKNWFVGCRFAAEVSWETMVWFG